MKIKFADHFVFEDIKLFFVTNGKTLNDNVVWMFSRGTMFYHHHASEILIIRFLKNELSRWNLFVIVTHYVINSEIHSITKQVCFLKCSWSDASKIVRGSRSKNLSRCALQDWLCWTLALAALAREWKTVMSLNGKHSLYFYIHK